MDRRIDKLRVNNLSLSQLTTEPLICNSGANPPVRAANFSGSFQVPLDEPEQPVRKNHNDVRIVARKAITQMLQPLVGFALDSGLSAQELRSILREAAVRSVAARQLDVTHRVNISGIAASALRNTHARKYREYSSHSVDSSRQIYATDNNNLQIEYLRYGIRIQNSPHLNGKPADLKDIWPRRDLLRCPGKKPRTRHSYQSNAR